MEKNNEVTGGLIHIPVMVNEVLEHLITNPDGIYVDATLGCGGHSKEILKSLKGGLLIGMDCDAESVKIAEDNLKEFGNKIIVHASYTSLGSILKKKNIGSVDGVLFDLGVSMYQLLNPERGFSFQKNGFLDMRFDRNTSLRAYDVVNRFSARELEKIFREFGEEEKSKVIAKKIVDRRRKKEISTTTELSNLIQSVKKRKRIHPATKVFQALRIFVNNELENLKNGLFEAYNCLKNGGRIVVISYHSLEDRIVKQFFKSNPLRILTKKPLRPNRDEVLGNPSARSAKLRAAEKI